MQKLKNELRIKFTAGSSYKKCVYGCVLPLKKWFSRKFGPEKVRFYQKNLWVIKVFLNFFREFCRGLWIVPTP